MAYYKVRQGECLASIAKAFGFSDYKRIWGDGNNADFRHRRPNPNHVYPGDIIYVPEIEQRVETRATDQCHSFQLMMPKVLLRVVLKNSDEEPLANKKYALESDEMHIEGMTDGSGMLETKVPADCEHARLTVWEDPADDDKIFRRELGLGHLDPIDQIEGVQAPLNNLGFFCGAVDGIAGEKTKAALMAFQKKSGLPVSGKIDAPTLKKLREMHDAS